jgi:hypothetical protein
MVRRDERVGLRVGARRQEGGLPRRLEVAGEQDRSAVSRRCAKDETAVVDRSVAVLGPGVEDGPAKSRAQRDVTPA